MSRCVLDNEDLRTEVFIGWDVGGQTFFARVWDRNLYQTDLKAGVPEGEAGLHFQTGGYDRIWKTPDRLIEMIQPFACKHNKDRLRQELLADQANDDGDRSYSLCEDDPPEDY